MNRAGKAAATGAFAVFGGLLGASVGNTLEHGRDGVKNASGWGAVIGTFAFAALASASPLLNDEPAGTLSGSPQPLRFP